MGTHAAGRCSGRTSLTRWEMMRRWTVEEGGWTMVVGMVATATSAESRQVPRCVTWKPRTSFRMWPGQVYNTSF